MSKRIVVLSEEIANKIAAGWRLILIVILIMMVGLCVACGSGGGSASASNAGGANGDSVESFRFMVISDLHVRLPGNPDEIDFNAQDNLDKLTYSINRINTDYSNADFVITTGDMVGCLFSEDAADYGAGTDTTAERYKSLMETLKMPFYSVLGNHDYQKSYDTVNGEGVSSLNRAAIEAVWKKVLGIEPYYSIVHKGVRLIFANSNRGDAYNDVCEGGTDEKGCTGSFDSEQIVWLRAELANSEPAIIFLHHPPRTNNSLRKYFSIPSFLVKENDEFYDVAADNQDKILGIFVGHGHLWAKDELGNIPVYETGSIGDGNSHKDNVHIVDVKAAVKEMKVAIGNSNADYGL